MLVEFSKTQNMVEIMSFLKRSLFSNFKSRFLEKKTNIDGELVKTCQTFSKFVNEINSQKQPSKNPDLKYEFGIFNIVRF